MRKSKVHSELSKHYFWKGMRSDITNWCRSCLVCTTRHAGRASKPALVPIPVNGPFDKVGVDVIQFPSSQSGKKYAVVFMDYLTKRPEVFATEEQTALTIAQLFVEHIVSRHGVPVVGIGIRNSHMSSSHIEQVCKSRRRSPHFFFSMGVTLDCSQNR